jgi:hypothetical protein
MPKNYNVIDLSHLTKGFGIEKSLQLHKLLSMSYVDMMSLMVECLKDSRQST